MSSDCCTPSAGDKADEACERATKPLRAACPSCGQVGRPVDLLTVKAMLAIPLTELQADDYRFCRTPECSTVYYSVDGAQQFEEPVLRERVHQKHAASDGVFVCYCFQHSPGSIRRELCETGRITAVQRITAGIQAGQCACEVRNPQGSCCLGNVRAVVKRVEAEVAPVAPALSGR